MELFKDQYIRCDGLKIRYWEAGKGTEPLIFIHGIGASLEAWYNVFPDLSDLYHCIALDLPGHGFSDLSPEGYALPVLSKFLHSFIKEKGLSSVTLVGWSLGGAVSQRYLLDYGSKDVKRLVLVCSAGLGRELTFGLRFLTLPLLGEFFIKPTPNSTEKFLRHITHRKYKLTREIVDRFYRASVKFNKTQSFLKTVRCNIDFGGQKKEIYTPILSALKSITVPTQLIWGREDRILPVTQGVSAEKVIPGAKFDIFEECGHCPPMEYPEKFCEIVGEFVG